MFRAEFILKAGVVCVLASMAGLGCNPKKAEVRAPSYNQLNAIASA
jgi:hypothetical protein